MGHREDLLAGAKQCLFEKGFARTTSRDVVAASGTNLASIGYHFGSKEDLLFAALLDAMAEWDAEVTSITHRYAHPGSPEVMERAWDEVLRTFERHRPLLVAQIESWAQLPHSPELRAKVAAVYERNRAETAEALARLIPGTQEETGRAMATVFGAIAEGLMVQWLAEPANPPTGRDVRLALEFLNTQTRTSDGSTEADLGSAG